MDRLRWRRECVSEIIRQEYGQTAGGNAKNETSFRVAGNDGLQKIELFEECFQEPGHVHGIKLTAVASQFYFQSVLRDATRGTVVVVAEGASAKGDGAAAASGGKGGRCRWHNLERSWTWIGSCSDGVMRCKRKKTAVGRSFRFLEDLSLF